MKLFLTLKSGKTWAMVLLFGFISGQMVAQSAEKAPNITNETSSAEKVYIEENVPPGTTIEVPQNQSGSAIEAMWDLQFSYSASDSTGNAGNAAVVFLGTEFWISRWASDTLFRLNVSGSVIDTLLIDDGTGNGTNISGTRAMTTDGTYVYIGNNTTTIYEVDPSTWTVNSTISAPLAGNIRFITYDSTANGNQGGFWVGNFNTDITLINRSGQVISSIPSSIHGLGGMYGAAVDNFSQGGPYIWVFHQSGGPSAGTISQLQLPSGAPTGVTRDVDADLGSLGGLAGGLFISDEIVPGEVTLGGMLQADVLFGYELDFVPVQIDARLDYVLPTPAMGHIPLRMVEPMTFDGQVTNLGQQTLTSVDASLDVTDGGGASVYTNTANISNLANLQSQMFSLGPFVPTAEGSYTMTTTLSTGAQVDENPGDNSLALPFAITDSVLARDDGTHIGGNGYAVSSTSSAYAVVLYTFTKKVYLTGIEVDLATPIDGDTTYGFVVFTNNMQPSGGPLLLTDTAIISTSQNTYYLKFGSELPINPGDTWAIGVYEGANTTINLAQSANYFTPGVNFFSTDVGSTNPGWTASGIQTARAIRPVLVPCANFNLDVSVVNINQDLGNTTGSVLAEVSGSRGVVSYSWNDPNNSTADSVGGLAVGTYTVTVTDDNSCSATDSVTIIDQTAIEDDLAAGISKFEVYPNPSRDLFHLNIEMGNMDDINLTVVNLNGKVMMESRRNRVLNYQETLNLGGMSRGIYMLMVTTSKGTTFKRLILN